MKGELKNLKNGDKLTFDLPMNFDVWVDDKRRLTFSINELGEQSVQWPGAASITNRGDSFYARVSDKPRVISYR